MAENEKKTTEVADAESAKAVKADKKTPAKAKNSKPSLGSRIAAWCKATKAELKKIVWTPRDVVVKNTVLVLVCAVVASIVIGLLDYAFSSAIVGLSHII